MASYPTAESHALEQIRAVNSLRRTLSLRPDLKRACNPVFERLICRACSSIDLFCFARQAGLRVVACRLSGESSCSQSFCITAYTPRSMRSSPLIMTESGLIDGQLFKVMDTNRQNLAAVARTRRFDGNRGNQWGLIVLRTLVIRIRFPSRCGQEGMTRPENSHSQ